MSNPLDVQARQTVFIILESTSTRKLSLSSEWQAVVVSAMGQLSAAVERAHANGRRMVIILSEADFHEAIQQLKQVTSELMPRYGIVVIAKDPDAFLKERNATLELLDALPEKGLKKTIEFYLLRAVRSLIRAEEWGNPRVSQKTLERLNEIFIALSAERNPQRLLATIVLKGMDLTMAEGGTLYMVQETDGEMSFRLKLSNDRTNEISLHHINQKVLENSICGYVALTGKLMNIADVEALRPLTLPQFHKQIDHVHQTKTQSVLTIPLKNSRNEIIAILQLVNKKQRGTNGGGEPVSPFETEDESLISSFATQAAICLENVDLYADIQKLFDGFVKASITAIESRDPSTGGHSERVAKMTVALARATTDCDIGIYRSVKFKEEEIRELEYAALLHDFGKIGVREEVLVKAKKLYSYQLEGIKERMRICKAAAKITYLERRLKQGSSHDLALDREYQEKLKEIDRSWEIIISSNEPTVLKKESMETLDRIRSEKLLLPDGSEIALLTEDEYAALAVTQGSLTESERLEIESHVRHTYQFLKMIPWTKDFKHLPEIAYGHHEKLDGTGYPRGLTSHEIPLQSKIMTISDIFDALTAADRWYKEAVPTEKALDILAQEVSQGKIDPVLFELFVQKKIFDLTNPKNLKKAI